MPSTLLHPLRCVELLWILMAKSILSQVLLQLHYQWNIIMCVIEYILYYLCIIKYLRHLIVPLLHSSSTVGRLSSDGKMHITLCHFIKSWEDLTETQEKSLTQHYEMGCDCKVDTLRDILTVKADLTRNWKRLNNLLKKHLLFSSVSSAPLSWSFLRSLAAPPSPVQSAAQWSACGQTG